MRETRREDKLAELRAKDEKIVRLEQKYSSFDRRKSSELKNEVEAPDLVQ